MLILKVHDRIPEIEAISLLIDLAVYSNYIPLDAPPLGSALEVATYLARRGLTIPGCAAEMTVYKIPPRYFFNLIGPTWHSKGVKVSRVSPNGEEKELVDGDGQYHSANYWAKFNQSFADFERAISESNHELLLSAFAKGQAAIENFANVLPIKNIRECSVEEKLEKVWVSDKNRMPWTATRGEEPWKSFIEMKRVRNRLETHNKEDASGFTYQQIYEHFLLFPRAIPKTLFELHKICGMRCPASIVRASYFPHIEMQTAT